MAVVAAMRSSCWPWQWRSMAIPASAVAGDTDGIDGTQDNAGALLAPDSLARAAGKNVSAKAALANNDGYGFFSSIGDLIVTGPTRTNVNDFRAIIVRPQA